MGYPLQANAPQITHMGRTFAIGAFLDQNPMGAWFTAGVYEMKSDGWNLISTAILQIDPANLLDAVKIRGGIAGFMTWLVAGMNSFLAMLFDSSSAPSGEPTTADEVMAMVVARINAMRLTVVNGELVLA